MRLTVTQALVRFLQFRRAFGNHGLKVLAMALQIDHDQDVWYVYALGPRVVTIGDARLESDRVATLEDVAGTSKTVRKAVSCSSSPTAT